MRSREIDIAKGLAITLVVYGHCYRGLVAAGYFSETRWLSVVDYCIYTFHMPVFFLYLGYFSHRL